MLSENISAYVRRAGSFRFPKADENASASPVVNGLKTQQGVSYETGLECHWRKTVTRFSLYQLNLKDEITFDPNQTPKDPFGTNRNFDPTVRKGFSISEKIPITEKISLGSQYNLINARFQSGPNAGNRIPLVAESNLEANLNYQLSGHWTMFIEAIYTGNQFAANDDANIVGALGGYTFYNMNVKYEYKSLTTSFRVNNITNKYYYFYSVFNIYNKTESFYPAPGVNALLTISYIVT
jgi:iron complex outermembrane receptor protein